MATPKMLGLMVTFAYTGLMVTFWSGVYGTSIGFTTQMGENYKSLVGLHGIFVGVGEILGGLTFGIFGKYLSRFGRHYPVILGFTVASAGYIIAFINLPFDAPLGKDTDEDALIESNPYLAILGSFLLGLGDACYNTQIYSLIGSVFKDDSAAAFAIFKFSQSCLAAVAFFYSNHLELPYQLLILVIFCICGTATFCYVELSTRRLQSYNGPEEVDNSCGIAANTASTSDNDGSSPTA